MEIENSIEVAIVSALSESTQNETTPVFVKQDKTLGETEGGGGSFPLMQVTYIRLLIIILFFTCMIVMLILL